MGKLGVNGLQWNSKGKTKSPAQLLSTEHQEFRERKLGELHSHTTRHPMFNSYLGAAAVLS